MADRVIPSLRNAILCQHVHFDSEHRPFDLIEPLHTVALPDGANFPFRPAEMMLYTQLEDAVGTFRFTVEMRDEGGIVISRTRTPVVITFGGTTDRLDPVEQVFVLQDFEFPGPGVYDFVVMCNHVSMHEAELAPRPVYLRVFGTR